MKHSIILAVSLLLLFSPNASSQSLDHNDPLPIDKTIRKGVLPNGMTYYIKSTDVKKDAASYYIIQNVGSILENDDQQGLAHFLEHMAFNGTEHFPGKTMMEILQKNGAVMGKDINAYTGYDETVYSLRNIPVKDGMVDTCLTILNDWANYLLLTDEEIDEERAIIKEEWRTGQNGQARLQQLARSITFNHSKYVDRSPIGSMAIVENFDYKALRDFYHDWYRTDLQAIVIVGDVDVDGIEDKIIKRFSKIPAVENPRERFIVDIPENDALLFSLGTDPEVSTAFINLGIRHKNTMVPETIGSLKQQFLENMVTDMLSDRITEQSQKPESTFLGAGVSYGPLVRTSNAFTVVITPKENKQKEAFEEVMVEVMRAVKFGYSQPEIDRMILKIKSRYESQISRKEDMRHEQIERAIQNNYLENKTLTDVEKEYEIAKQLLTNITADELHQTIKRLYAKKNRYLTVVGVEGQDNLTKEQAVQIISGVENDPSILPYSEALGEKALVSGTIVKGTVAEEMTHSDIAAKTFVLSNGVKVHYKFADKDKDNVALYAMSYGGTSLLDDAYLPSASLVGNLVQMSGLGDFSVTDLKKVLTGKTANVRIGLGNIKENITGSSNTKDVETMFQMVYLYFVKPRFEEQAYEVLEDNVTNYISSMANDLNGKKRDSLTVALYGKNNPRARIFDQAYMDEVSFEKIKRIYEDRFSDVSDFEFFIVGDVKEDDLKRHLEKYLASIPTKNIDENFKDNDPEWVSNTIDRNIYIEMKDPKASVNIEYKKEMPYSMRNSIYTSALGSLLQLRVTETIREEAGGAYSPRASADFSIEPKPMATISVRFDCNPDMVDSLVEVVKDELQKIADGTINGEDLEKTKTNFLKERLQSKDSNNYDMQLLASYFLYGYDISDPKNFEDIVNGMTVQDIQGITANILTESMKYEIVFKPLVVK